MSLESPWYEEYGYLYRDEDVCPFSPTDSLELAWPESEEDTEEFECMDTEELLEHLFITGIRKTRVGRPCRRSFWNSVSRREIPPQDGFSNSFCWGTSFLYSHLLVVAACALRCCCRPSPPACSGFPRIHGRTILWTLPDLSG